MEISPNTNASAGADMDRPYSPQIGPYPVMVEEGRTYRWCSCGLSADQPWCDDSHEGTGFEPIEFVAPITAEFYICLLYTSPSPRDGLLSRMPSSA